MARWLLVVAGILSLGTAPSAWAKPPRLTLLITIDSFGTDALQKARPRFKAGLAQLLNQGALFPDVRYEYAETVTSAGHATLVTGANPWRHGIVGNRILNRVTGKLETAYADPNHPVLEAPLSVEDSSPENLLCETVADRLRLTTHQRGKVVAVADKARSAIAFAGRLGQAYWFNPQIGRFVTGTYYTKETPHWLKAFNEKKLTDGWFGKSWTLSLPAKEYLGEDDRPIENDAYGMGRAFPHSLTGSLPSPGPQFYSALATSPMMNDIVVQLAKTAITSEGLGRDDQPDLLGVSFSAVDRIYHHYGPYSWEFQDALNRLDKSMAELLSAAEKAAGGKNNLLVVLSADHGGAAIPEEWAAMGLPAARFNPATWFPQLNKELQAKFGAADLVLGFEEVDVYLNPKALSDKKLDAVAVRRFVAAWLSRQPALAFAIARDDLEATDSLSNYRDTLRKGFFAERSGDVLIVPKPYRVILYGRGIRPGTVNVSAKATDVAPTLAHLLEMGAPASSEGQALPVPMGATK
jgi:predicted AlkP superfamily pyrophosphatase or phosphodiesterase